MLIEHEECHHVEAVSAGVRSSVIDLIESGQSVAEGLEVSDQTVYNWGTSTGSTPAAMRR